MLRYRGHHIQSEVQITGVLLKDLTKTGYKTLGSFTHIRIYKTSQKK